MDPNTPQRSHFQCFLKKNKKTTPFNTFENEVTADWIDQDAEMETVQAAQWHAEWRRRQDAKVGPVSRTLLWGSRCGGENICQRTKNTSYPPTTWEAKLLVTATSSK